MFTAIWRTVLASALFLTLTVSAKAAEEKQTPPAKAEKKTGEMDKKQEMGKVTSGGQSNSEVQEALKAKGNDPGPIDGKMGPKTRAALKAFQEANGLKGTGQMDDQTADKLGIAKMGAPMGTEMKATKKEKMEPMSKEPMSKEKK
jgi:peptidoglycan hydrolase-like protein with peptidoglycan-binding domain